MSKSKGNAVTPQALLEQYGSDGVRYWAALGRPGSDTALEEQQMKIGRRLVLKLFNVSKFVLGLGREDHGLVDHPLDLAMLARLGTVVEDASLALESYDYSTALVGIEAFFWWFCDDYVELVKRRAYHPGGRSARHTLARALGIIQRLLAPFLPFACEETWRCWQPGSVHRAPWPVTEAGLGDAALLQPVSLVLAAIRKAKTDARQSMKAVVAQVEVVAGRALLERLQQAREDLVQAGQVEQLLLNEGAQWQVRVQL